MGVIHEHWGPYSRRHRGCLLQKLDRIVIERLVPLVIQTQDRCRELVIINYDCVCVCGKFSFAWEYGVVYMYSVHNDK